MIEDKSNEYYLTLIKSKIIGRLCTNENVVKLIAPKENDDLDLDDILLGGEWMINGKQIKEQGYIFDYNYVDDTITDSRVSICVETLPGAFHFPTIDVMIFIHIYVHKDIMKLTSESSIKPSVPTKNEMNNLGFIGNRCDQLTQVIGKMLNGVSNIGGITEIKPRDNGYIGLDIPNKEFYGKCMVFKAKISDVEQLNCENN